MTNRRRVSRVLAGVLGTAVLVVLAVLSPRALPYNMDEFVHYHALGCATAPLGKDLPSFRDGCGLYDLRPPLSSTWLPLRSYYYIGSIPAVPFFPFWLITDDPVSARVQGALFLVAFVLLAARLLEVAPARTLLAAAVFPFFPVAFLVDQGPVGLSALLLLGAMLAVRRAVQASRPESATGWAVLAGLAIFGGLWVKPVFAWWFPAVAAFTVVEVRRGGDTVVAMLKRLRPALVAGGLALLVPSILLFASLDADGRPYGAAVLRSRLSLEPSDVAGGVDRLATYFLNASYVAPRNVGLPPSPFDVGPALVGALVLAVGVWRRGGREREIAVWALLGGATFVVAATSAFSQWPHHAFFPALLVVFALALALDGGGRRLRAVATILVVPVWLSLAARLPAATHPRTASPGKDELLSLVRERGLDHETFQVHASWGTYYVAQLFGDRERMVVFVRGISDDAAQLRQVACLAREAGRRLLLISSRRWDRLQTDTVDAVLGRPEQTWRFDEWWAVAYATARVEGCPAREQP